MKPYRLVLCYDHGLRTFVEYRVPTQPDESIRGIPLQVVNMACASVFPNELSVGHYLNQKARR